jgi:hypothetical protein
MVDRSRIAGNPSKTCRIQTKQHNRTNKTKQNKTNERQKIKRNQVQHCEVCDTTAWNGSEGNAKAVHPELEHQSPPDRQRSWARAS